MEQDKNAFYPLEIIEIKRETPLAVSVFLDIPKDKKELFSFLQGQYLTLKFDIDGNEERRAYSLATSPLESKFGFTVKEIENGFISTLINKKTKVGDILYVMPPQGRFIAKTDSSHHKTYYFFAAGSGITPIMSMIKSILEIEGGSTVHLLYGNKTKESTIFYQELLDMSIKYEGALTVDFTFTAEAPQKSNFWSKKDPLKEGRIDAKKIDAFFKKHKSYSQITEYYICGPNLMIDTIEEKLLKDNINKKNIHIERFTAKEEDENMPALNGKNAQLKANLNGESILLNMTKDQTILEALMEADYDPPYSCKNGTCSSCMAKIVKGSAEMKVCYALDDDEIEDGYILTCQATPTSAQIEIDYDVD